MTDFDDYTERVRQRKEKLLALSTLIKIFAAGGAVDASEGVHTGWVRDHSVSHIRFKTPGTGAAAWIHIEHRKSGEYAVRWGYGVGYSYRGGPKRPRILTVDDIAQGDAEARKFALNQLYMSVHSALIRTEKLLSP